MRRPGIALLVVLWVLSVAAVLTLTAVLGGRSGVDAAQNRMDATEARFAVSGCAALTLAQLDQRLLESPAGRLRETEWDHLDLGLATLGPPVDDCRRTLRSGGARLNVNRAGLEGLHRMFLLAVPETEARALASAIEDWRDSDDEPNPRGAERDWYLARRLSLPTNQDFRSTGELLRVRAMGDHPELLPDLDVEGTTVDIMHASAVVLASLPGISPRLAAAIVARRRDGWRPSSVTELAALVPSADAPDFGARFVDLSRIARVGPETWILTVSASAGASRMERSEELTVTLTSSGLTPIRRRVW